MNPLRVLITNTVLAERTGTEMYVRDLALALRARGDVPIAYSPTLGPVAEELVRAGVTVTDRLTRVSPAPDVIHGHHEIPTMAAFLRFAGVPGIFVCHARLGRTEIPPWFPRIRRYVAVDDNCRERLVERRIPADLIRVVYNGVDLDRFQPRGPLPERPRRALVFSNYASGRTHLGVVREACDSVGLPLDVIGAASGHPCAHPESILGRYDLVFAKGRCALEALAVGTAVIPCDVRGIGPLVTTAGLEALRRHSFGSRVFRHPITPDLIVREIARYDSRDADEVSRRVRETVGLTATVERLALLYREVLAEQVREGSDPDAEASAAAAYWSNSRGRRLRDRLWHWPIVGPWSVALKRVIAPSAADPLGRHARGGRAP
jgi:glycosyltransferase involved in cell wall biosynthesis